LSAANECCLDGQKEGGYLRLFRSVVTALFLGLTTAAAQTPQSHGTPAERVIIEYEKLVANGAFLTPEGWKMAGNLYDQSDLFPDRSEISLMSTGGSLGENWVHGDRAEVETKWTDYDGTIDSTLRYKPPKHDFPVTMTTYVFHLVYTNKHRDIGKNGETVREVTGPLEWKIEEPRMARWTTVNRAIEYLALMRDKTDDPVIKRNAVKTIATLKRMGKPCGNASAC
jgi:hypothetical protein